MSANQDRRRAIADHLVQHGLTEQVVLLPDMLTDAEVREDAAGFASGEIAEVFEIRKDSPTVWQYYSEETGDYVRVHKKANGITCSCPSFRKNRAVGCKHIGDFCRQNGLPDPTGGKIARRLALPIAINPDGQSEKTVENNAKRNRPKRCRELLYDLCKDVKDTRPRSGGPRGQPRVPLAVIIYALLYKVLTNSTYEELQFALARDDGYRKIVHRHRGSADLDPPHPNVLSKVMADPAVEDVIQEILVRTARPGRNLDFAIAFDGSGFGTTMRQNWRNDRPNPTDAAAASNNNDESAAEPAKKKTGRPPKGGKTEKTRLRGYLKVNPSVGLVSGLIYAIVVTGSMGYGTHDNEQFETLFHRTRPNCNFDIVACDAGYYDNENFQLCQETDVLLFVMPRKNVRPHTSAVPLEAFSGWLWKEHPAVVRRFYRLRPLIEGTFSRSKRRNGHIKLRRRRHERARFALLTYPFDMAEKVSKQIKHFREVLNRIIARERVGIAQRNEATAKAIVANLQRLAMLETKHRDTVNFDADKALVPMRRVSPPTLDRE